MAENIAPTGAAEVMDTEVDFKEIDWAQREREDAELMSQMFNNDPMAEKLNIFGEPDEQAEKADNAVDYEDMSDEDLPEEEEASGNNHEDVPGLTDDNDMGTSHDTDDLFGEDGRDSSPIFGDEEEDGTYVAGGRVNGVHNLPESEPEPEIDLRELNFPGFRMTNQDPSIPATAESEEELIKQLYPSFEKGITLDWNDLMPPRKAYYNPKVPVKPPKVLNPTKISLELAPDQEKSFRSAGPAATTDIKKRRAEAESKGLVPILEDTTADDSSDDGFDWSPLDPDEPIAGTTMGMIGFTCADWDSAINAVPSTTIQVPEDEAMDDWDREILGASSKKRKAPEELDYINAPRYPVPYFDNYEQMTAHIGKKVVIDLNDPHLLVEKLAPVPAAKRRRLGVGGSFKRGNNGSLAAALHTRFNFSNDEAYNALKENHQSKVRATLANEDVEHSLPALKLLWPYYRVKLDRQLARTYHRPYLKFTKFLHQAITFSRGLPRKRKDARKLGGVQEVFKDAKDLTLAETQSHATLIEYCEEHPNVLSNFGMGNRITSYYRRKDGKDMERPKIPDNVGDTHILLAEDKSPFSNFGFVDPGETVRTIHNGMYRAPIFKHEIKSTDFLVVRSSTGVGGTDWFVRTIDHLFVAGQQFPVVEIPGPHSRKVTNAAKNRMKMVAYRKIKHSPNSTLKISEITAHIADSSDMQNRQKLKEFLTYDKTQKVWVLKQGDTVPDEPSIRVMVSPEEVCLIDAMQVGDTHLTDAGYAEEDEDKEPVDGVEHSLEQELAPWKTSKAFLEASADKAMLQLHGDGDPSGCGQAFSMIKTSMKGGYIGATKGSLASSASASEELRKQNGGHVYNVKKQQDMYNEAIRTIWEKQKTSLSNPVENADIEDDRDNENEAQKHAAPTPRHMATPAAFDDNASQFSVGSRQGRAMRIVRTIKNYQTAQNEEVVEVVKDVRVWREYQRRVHERDAEGRE